jgi:hypothetical protein
MSEFFYTPASLKALGVSPVKLVAYQFVVKPEELTIFYTPLVIDEQIEDGYRITNLPTPCFQSLQASGNFIPATGEIRNRRLPQHLEAEIVVGLGAQAKEYIKSSEELEALIKDKIKCSPLLPLKQYRKSLEEELALLIGLRDLRQEETLNDLFRYLGDYFSDLKELKLKVWWWYQNSPDDCCAGVYMGTMCIGLCLYLLASLLLVGVIMNTLSESGLNESFNFFKFLLVLGSLLVIATVCCGIALAPVILSCLDYFFPTIRFKPQLTWLDEENYKDEVQPDFLAIYQLNLPYNKGITREALSEYIEKRSNRIEKKLEKCMTYLSQGKINFFQSPCVEGAGAGDKKLKRV